MSVSFAKNQDEITKAWRDVVDSADSPKWALFGYEGTTNNIKLISTGSKGLNELVQEFNCSLIQYAFCRVIDQNVGLNKLVLINWQGDSSPLSRKGLCASHVSDVSNYFKGCTQTITIRNDDEATEEYLMEQIMKTSASKIKLAMQQQQQQQNSELGDSSAPIGSTYKKTDISSEIPTNRKSFWQRQEEEEKERLAEEKRRAAEKQAQFERERKLREESEAKKLAETVKERDRLIEATRRADSMTDSQPSSMSSSKDLGGDDDSRVGRRSELIRLERNQETQSLITKGLIKNKRAIFEQAQQQQQQQQPTLMRRSSGVKVTQRINAFKSLDCSTNSVDNSHVESSSATMSNLANGFAKKVSVGNDESPKVIKKEIEPVNLSREDSNDIAPSSSIVNQSISNTNTISSSPSEIEKQPSPVKEQPVKELPSETRENNPQDVNGNKEPTNGISNPDVEEAAKAPAEDGLLHIGKNDTQAVALYDYQAADNTEISFDPEDVIGCIQKVDPGWWHGKVMTGRHKGQVGLFPANHVQEL